MVELENLINIVNKYRYRGPTRYGPMTDGYGQPMRLMDRENISEVALAYVLALEKQQAKVEPNNG